MKTNLTDLTDLYQTDFYQWTIEQSDRLRLGKFAELDLENLAEEIESLGKQQRQELRNRLGILIGHLLKWHYQPEKQSKSWRVTIRGQRREIKYLLLQNPSLKPYLDEAILLGYAQGIDLVIQETDLDDRDLPKECPYSLEQIFDDNFPVAIEE
jgi:Domain of unknown function DUF29